MAQIQSPYGLRVLKNLGEGYFSGGMHTYPVLTSAALTSNGLFYGDPVGLQGGTVVPLTATPGSAGPPGVLGVFQGAEWQDPIRGYVNALYIPGNIFATGATNVKAKVYDYPQPLMRVQADSSLPDGGTPVVIGNNIALGGFGNGNTFTGNSRVFATGAPAAAGAVRIVGFIRDAAPSPGAGSMPGDPYTDLLVTWNFGVDRYMNAVGG